MFSFEVSTNRRIAQCACAIFWCLLSGGPIFGFAALKPVLVKEHVYEKLCDVSVNSTLSSYSMDPNAYGSLTVLLLSNYFNVAQEEEGVAKCTPQDLKLNMMFTVGAVLTNVSALVIGRLLDIYGPRFCGLIGAVFLYLASFIFIFAKHIEATEALSFFDPYLIGYAFMALGGPFAYISSFQLSNSFPKKSGTILALLTGAFDASSAVFLVYRIIYTKTNASFTLDKFFKVYLFVPIFITAVQIFVMPADSYKTPPETTLCVDDVPEEEARTNLVVSETDALLSPHTSNPNYSHRRDSIGDAIKQPYADEGEARLIEYSGGIFGILHGYSAQYQIKTPWFYLMCLFATIQMLRLNYFVATISTQYSFLFHSIAKAEKLTKFFDIALPLGGVISIPFVGMFLDNFSTVVVLSALLIVSILIGLFGLFGIFTIGIINVCFFVAYRPFFYTAVSDFCAKVFGFDTFGTVYGAIICFSGVFNFAQSALDKATHNSFNMNPTPINVILLITTVVIGLITLTYVEHQAKLYRQKKMNQLNGSA